MKYLRNNILAAILTVIGCMMGSCVLHEEPEMTENGELGEDPTLVFVDADITLDLTLPETDGTDLDLGQTEGYMRRIIIEAYNSDREMCRRQVVYEKETGRTHLSVPVSMRLHAIPYRLVVWSDYVSEEAPETGVIYNAETLIPVINEGSYRGNTELKDAFSGYTDIDLLPYADQYGAKIETAVELERPMGRYCLITTDVGAFVRRVSEGAVNGTTFTARIKYSGSLSVGLNCYDQVRKHSLLYMAYSTNISKVLTVGEPNMQIGFDYIFTAPDETLEIPVEIEIVNENNEAVSNSFISIPVARGMNTTVKGRFLTSTSDGGISIDQNYDGNIEIDLGTLTPTR